jgi:hypothetical protein
MSPMILVLTLVLLLLPVGFLWQRWLEYGFISLLALL